MLLTPSGVSSNIEPLMLLYMWAKQLDEENPKEPSVIIAGLGKPSFPVSIHLAQAAYRYWSDILKRAKKARYLVDHTTDKGIYDEKIMALNASIEYGDPQGDLEPRKKIAEAFTRWYDVAIDQDNILFTVGGLGGLRIVFDILNKKRPRGRIITTFPYYVCYRGLDTENKLHPIHVMKNPGYKLTAKSFENSLNQALKLAKKDGHEVSAFLLCDPNNPLGTIVEPEELEKIATILRKYPDILIVLDEAYAEMVLNGRKHISFLSVAADIKKRIIVLRSATKALSAAGERMAAIIAFDKKLMAQFLQKNIALCGHAPRSLQYAFAEGMQKLDEAELKTLDCFYRSRVQYVQMRLEKMGAAMPDPYYKVEGTFYVLCDMSKLLGVKLPLAAKRALNKTGKVITDEDLVYYLLFNNRIMLAPLSYFGLSAKAGILRITCTGSRKTLKALMDILEDELIKVK